MRLHTPHNIECKMRADDLTNLGHLGYYLRLGPFHEIENGTHTDALTVKGHVG